ncbi:reverse transcriptase domain-containing protein [Tanacetum coccineum]
MILQIIVKWEKKKKRGKNAGWFTKKSESANAMRRTTWFGLILKSNIDQNEDHILGPSTVAITKKLKEIIQKDKLTIADLEGACLEKLKLHYKNDVELDIVLINSKEKCSKPHPSCYNNNFYYLVDLSTKEKYTTSLTKHYASRYHIQEEARQDFFKAQINNQTPGNVYSNKKIISVVRVVVKKKWGYGFLSSIVIRKSDKQEYTFSYVDRLSLNDIEDIYLLKVQDKMHHLPSEDERDFNNAPLLIIRRTVIKNRVKDLQLGVENYQRTIICCLWRCDNGTEFKNKEMNQFCERKGIKREFSVARTPQQNGVAERKNRTLIEAARTMLANSKLPTTF